MVHTISVRIDDKSIRELREHKVNISEVVRKALDEEIRKTRMKEMEKKLDRIKELLKNEKEDDFINALRETRKER